MNLPTLDSSYRSGPVGPTTWANPDDLAQSTEACVKAGAGAFPGWPSSLYKLNRQAPIPPREPAESVPVQMPTAVRAPEASLRKSPSRGETGLQSLAELRPAEHLDKSDPLRFEWESYHHGAFPLEPQKNLLIHWAEQIPCQFEPQLLVRGLKLYLDRDVEKARMLARWAVGRYPESRDLQKLLQLLTPSKVVTRTASGASRKDDFEWIRANQRLYSGQWVAIFKGKCLASGRDLHSVRETARKLVNLQQVLIAFLPKEKRRAPFPEER